MNTKVRHCAAFIFGMSSCLLVQAQEPFVPQPIAKCLTNPVVKGVVLQSKRNPYYLRGDFDGDGAPDYAIIVRSLTTKSNGVLVCRGNGSVVRLGSGIGGPQFSDMAADNFIAPNWAVYTRKETADLKSFSSNVPRPVPSPVAESIVMIWEDGISLIYWDGKKFRWAGSEG